MSLPVTWVDGDTPQRALLPLGPSMTQIHGLPLTGETRCLKIRLKPDCAEKVRQWFVNLKAMPGVADVLRAEGVLVESVFLDRTPDGDCLIFYLRAADLKKSKQVYSSSRLPVN